MVGEAAGGARLGRAAAGEPGERPGASAGPGRWGSGPRAVRSRGWGGWERRIGLREGRRLLRSRVPQNPELVCFAVTAQKAVSW